MNEVDNTKSHEIPYSFDLGKAPGPDPRMPLNQGVAHPHDPLNFREIVINNDTWSPLEGENTSERVLHSGLKKPSEEKA